MVKVSRLWTPPIWARLVATLPSQASMLDRAVDAPPEVLTELYNGLGPDRFPRPLRRLLAHTVETALSKEIIKGEIKEGDVVTIGLANGEFTFSAK